MPFRMRGRLGDQTVFPAVDRPQRSRSVQNPEKVRIVAVKRHLRIGAHPNIQRTNAVSTHSRNVPNVEDGIFASEDQLFRIWPRQQTNANSPQRQGHRDRRLGSDKNRFQFHSPLASRRMPSIANCI
jgi:hypothetical protein